MQTLKELLDRVEKAEATGDLRAIDSVVRAIACEMINEIISLAQTRPTETVFLMRMNKANNLWGEGCSPVSPILQRGGVCGVHPDQGARCLSFLAGRAPKRFLQDGVEG